MFQTYHQKLMLIQTPVLILIGQIPDLAQRLQRQFRVHQHAAHLIARQQSIDGQQRIEQFVVFETIGRGNGPILGVRLDRLDFWRHDFRDFALQEIQHTQYRLLNK